MKTAFDTIVITAADERQADCFRRQAEGFAGRLARRVLVVPDPGGRRVGTLGSTVNVLRTVRSSGRLLVCHCGGFSKRLPAYAASGKVFAPVPTEGGAKTLFEIIVANMSELPLPAHGALVVCGDVAPRFDFGRCDFSARGVTGVGCLDTLARGSRHGVFVPARWTRGRTPVADFLQKPTARAARAAGAVRRNRVAVDTGVLWLDAPTCAKLATSGWTEGDLYADFTAALLKGFAPFSVNVVPRCDFFHIGSSRELLDLLGGGREWVDGCGVARRAMRLGGENIVTGVPAGYAKAISLGRGECLLCLPTGAKGWSEVRYRIDDNFKEDGKWTSLGLDRLMKRVNFARLGDLCAKGRSPDRVTVVRPLRIDLAGGWSDTPPICNEMGGCVLNAAVTIGPEMPVRVTVGRLAEREVRIASADLRKTGVLRSMAEIRDHSDPHDWRALVKSALAVTGYDLGEGGLDIAISADVPKGSGMGTSSILGSAVVEALGKVRGRDYTTDEIADLTLALEREMRTGGGWEDQMGALVPGVKLLSSARGARQRIRVKRLSSGAERDFAAFLEERALLYFTGQKRMARNVLNGVVSYYRRNPCDIAREIVRRLKADAARSFDALERRDWHAFASVLNAYWVNKKALDPGSTNPRVEAIVARVAPFADAVTLCGAGGGGFMLIVARDRAAKRKVRRILETGSPVRGGRFFTLSLAL